MSQPSFTFSLSLPSPTRYGPRLGTILYRRPSSSAESPAQIQIPTPGLITSTSRGVVPHLSRDNHRATSAIRWVNVPFETFLEHNPPVPTLQPGSSPLHTFLGFTPGKHILSMSARDPYDGREMPPNGAQHVSVNSLRGVRKLSPSEWRSYVLSCKPDIVFALSDTPFTDPPYSQKRLSKSIDRSAMWLSTLLKPLASSDSESEEEEEKEPPNLNVFVHMAGGTSIPARKAFADNLLEKLHGPEAEAIAPLTTLDEGVAGYSFDLVPLRQSLEATEQRDPRPSSPTALNPIIPPHTSHLTPLLRASLSSVPEHKPRLVNSTEGPHEILAYISEVGVDLFDAHWAQRAADVGVALDFEFPVRDGDGGGDTSTSLAEGEEREKRKREIGHNLYDARYALDFKPFADAFRGAIADGHSTSTSTSTSFSLPICPCLACSPYHPPSWIYHGIDSPEYTLTSSSPCPSAESGPHYKYKPPHTRAYIHHLLHTHEMSAHTLLVMHNLEVLDAFFAGIRSVIAGTEKSENAMPDVWAAEVERFNGRYEAGMRVLDAARESWKKVELARGKGRLAREKERQEEEGTEVRGVEVEVE